MLLPLAISFGSFSLESQGFRHDVAKETIQCENKCMAAPVEKIFLNGEALFKENQQSDSLFLIKKGTVAIRKLKGTDYVEIARVYSNEVIGEMGFFDRAPRSASAFAVGDVEVVLITYEAMDKIYAAIPPYMKTIINSIVGRLRKANDQIRKLQKDVVKDSVPAVSQAKKEQTDTTGKDPVKK